MERCFFCQEPLNRRPQGAPAEAVNQHHIICRRYFGRESDPNFRNLAWAHTSCHRRWHRKYDDQRLSLEAYLDKMDALAFGRGIFRSDVVAYAAD